jgi:hypothetical protein
VRNNIPGDRIVPKPKEERFVLEELSGGYRLTCKECLESSRLEKNAYRARRWAPVHTRTEIPPDLDPIAAAQYLMAAGYDFDE